MPITCDSEALLQGAKCLDCIPKANRAQVELYLLAYMANQLNGLTMDPGQLVKLSACFQCIPKEMRESVREMLMCQIASVLGA